MACASWHQGRSLWGTSKHTNITLLTALTPIQLMISFGLYGNIMVYYMLYIYMVYYGYMVFPAFEGSVQIP